MAINGSIAAAEAATIAGIVTWDGKFSKRRDPLIGGWNQLPGGTVASEKAMVGGLRAKTVLRIRQNLLDHKVRHRWDMV